MTEVGSFSYESILRVKDAARRRIYEASAALPEDVANILKQLWADLENKLNHVLKDPIFCKLIASIGSSSDENAAVLLTALAHVNECLSAAEITSADLRSRLTATEALCSAQDAQLSEMRQRLTDSKKVVVDLEKQLAQYKATAQHYHKQTAELMLRQASFMVVNKLARLCLPAKDGSQLTPYQASRYNLDNLFASKLTDKAKLEGYLSAKPNLGLGLKLLAGTYSGTAHPAGLPHGMEDVCGPNDDIMKYLHTCLEAECLAGTFPDSEAVEEVLTTLQELSEELHEPLIISVRSSQVSSKL